MRDWGGDKFLRFACPHANIYTGLSKISTFLCVSENLRLSERKRRLRVAERPKRIKKKCVLEKIRVRVAKA